jgi:hypothetical protein
MQDGMGIISYVRVCPCSEGCTCAQAACTLTHKLKLQLDVRTRVPHGKPTALVSRAPHPHRGAPCPQLKYYQTFGNASTLALATQLGDFLITQTLTPGVGAYPSITRSSGLSWEFPETIATQDDILFGGCVLQVSFGVWAPGS